ncbi:MAG: biopolymer transporter ExbD [Gammaproteobacteria bacterium]|nr:MAG: biopolymer transporter ExbD [Gammaproteobacteria bacterium]
MARRKAKPVQDEAQIDMTPMLDIVFIMLIFFIVTASFVKESGITVDKPTAETATKRPKANIFIGIDNRGDIYMLKNKVDKDAVKAMLEDMLLENPESTIVVQADSRAEAESLLNVLDAAKAAGVKNISVAAEQ